GTCGLHLHFCLILINPLTYERTDNGNRNSPLGEYQRFIVQRLFVQFFGIPHWGILAVLLLASARRKKSPKAGRIKSRVDRVRGARPPKHRLSTRQWPLSAG